MAEVLSDEDMKDQVVEETMLLAKKDLMQVMKVLARMDMIIFPFCNVIFVRHGHIENFCREKAKHPANYVEEKYGESNLFFTCSNKQKSSNKIWFLDSGCSNNVTGAKELLQNIPGFIKQLVFLGNIKQVQAEGRDTVRSADNTMLVMGVSMAANKMFTFRMAEIDLSLFANLKDHSNLWHMMDGHLNFHGLNLLHRQKMVIGMPSIDHVGDICEGCIYGKQHRASFLVGKAWGATKPLQLAHTNICSPMQALSLNNIDGIQRLRTASYTSDQNDVVKRNSRTVVEMTRIML